MTEVTQPVTTLLLVNIYYCIQGFAFAKSIVKLYKQETSNELFLKATTFFSCEEIEIYFFSDAEPHLLEKNSNCLANNKMKMWVSPSNNLIISTCNSL